MRDEPSAYDQCDVKRSNAWSLMRKSPAKRETLLGLKWNGKTVRDELNSGCFTQGGMVLARPCRHHVVPISGYPGRLRSQAETAQFRLTQEGWSTVSILENVCVAADKR